MMLKTLLLKTHYSSSLLKISQTSKSMISLQKLNVRSFSTQDPVDQSTDKKENQPKETQVPSQQSKSKGLFSKKKDKQPTQSNIQQQQQVVQQEQFEQDDQQLQYQYRPEENQQRGLFQANLTQEQQKYELEPNQKIAKIINEDEYIVEEVEEFSASEIKAEKDATKQVKDLLNKYKAVQGDWTDEVINQFLKDLVQPRNDVVYTDKVSFQQLKDTGSKEFKNLNPDFQKDFTLAGNNLHKFTNINEQNKQYKPEKLNPEQFQVLQKHMLYQKKEGGEHSQNAIRQVYAYMTNYLTSIGSEAYQNHVSDVIIKTNLVTKDEYFSLLNDIFINTTDVSNSTRVKSVVLERFVTLILQLDQPDFYKQFPEIQQQFQDEIYNNFGITPEQDTHGLVQQILDNPELLLQLSVLSIAKNHNYFGKVEKYMKRFSKQILETCPQLAVRLETALQKEIVIKNPFNTEDLQNSILKQQSNYGLFENEEISHLALSQPGFQFLPRVLKVDALKEYNNIIQTFQKTKEAQFALNQIEEGGDAISQNKLMSSINDFNLILQELDKHAIGKTLSQVEVKHAPLIEKAQNALEILTSESKQIVKERYDIDGVSLTNLEDLYNPNNSGFIDMLQTRSYLIEKGMTAQFADQLAKRYIDKYEQTDKIVQQGIVCTVMDLFDSDNSKVQNALHNTSYQDIVLNYMTWGEYKDRLYNQRLQTQLQRNQHLQSKEFQVNFQHSFTKQMPIRPVGIYARAFSTSNRLSKEEQREAILQQDLTEQKDDDKSKSKFTEFINTLEELDKQPPTAQAAQADYEDYDLSELDISFDKVPGGIKTAQQDANQQIQQETQQQLDKSSSPPSTLTPQQQRALLEREILANDSRRHFDLHFFKNFAFSGPDQATLSQKSLEEFIINMDVPKEIQQLIVSMTTQAYEINPLIPNVNMLFYKMFNSPITTKEQRKGKDSGDNILVGNIFAQKGVELSYFGYKSLLETIILEPKKKHFKKVVSYLLKYEKPENVDPEIIDIIVRLGVDQKYPIFLGQTVKYFVQNGYNISLSTFQNFILFLEKCKGFEEDAKRFVFLTNETENLEFSYGLIQPIFIRNMKKKSGNEILKLFEQFRKNIKLNKKYKDTPANEKQQLLLQKKREFYDGLLNDLISYKAYGLAQIVYSEKTREKFDVNTQDNIIGLKIFSNQRKLDEYVDLFNKIINDKDGQANMTADVCYSIAQDLQLFDAEKEKSLKLDMASKLKNRIQEYKIFMTPQLFDSLIYLFTETQQWIQVIDLMNSSTPQNCQPELKTINYLKKNLLYVFESGQRNQLKAAIENVENTFFSKAQLVQDIQKQIKKKDANQLEGDRQRQEKLEFSRTAREKAKLRRGQDKKSQEQEDDDDDENMA